MLFLNVSTTVTLVSDADGDGNADAGDVLRLVTLVTNNRGVDLTNVSLTVDLADALRRMPGTVRIYEDASSSTYVEHDVPFSRATVFRNGSWFIDDNQNGYYDVTDATAYFGAPGDLPVLGDWNGDGIDEIGVFRNGTWFLDVTGDGIYNAGDATIVFGQAGDLPVVGEWDGTGRDRIGVFRNGTWYLCRLDFTGSNPWRGAACPLSIPPLRPSRLRGENSFAPPQRVNPEKTSSFPEPNPSTGVPNAVNCMEFLRWRFP